MGYYSQSCILSGLPITGGTKCQLVLIVPVNPNLYILPCFPISGVYDNYGRIESIEENCNTKALEEYFGMPIKQITDNVTGHCDGHKTKSYGNLSPEKIAERMVILKTVSYCWLREDIVSELTSTYPDSEKEYNYATCYGSPFLLEHIGAIRTPAEDKDGRYSMCYKYNNHQIFTDGDYIESSYGIYSTDEFIKYIDSIGVDSKVLEGFSGYDIYYDFKLRPQAFQYYEAQLQLAELEKYPNESNLLKRLKLQTVRPVQVFSKDWSLRSFLDYQMMEIIATEDEAKSLYYQFTVIERYMQNAGRFWGPTGIPPQDPQYHLHKLFLNALTKCVDKELLDKELEEYD